MPPAPVPIANWLLLLITGVVLLGIYPATYLAYSNVLQPGQRKRLEEDFYLLGLETDDARRLTPDELYDTAYNPRQYWAYIALILLVGLLVFLGFGLRSELAVVSPEQMTVMFFAFLGAYVFSVYELVRRYNTFDLMPQVYSSILMRMLAAMAIAFAAGAFLLADAAAQPPPPLPIDWASAAAFLIGMFPNRGLRWLRDRLSGLFSTGDDNPSSLPLRQIQGISPWHEARLIEMGVDDVQNLATIDIRKLLLTTRFDTQEIVSWIDQAILLDKVRGLYERFKQAHIASFHQFRQRLLQVGTCVDPAQLEDARHTLAASLGLADAAELDYLADPSNYPNYTHIFEYYLNAEKVVRQRATAGAEKLLGAERTEDFEQAEREYRQRVGLNPTDVKLRANYGLVLYKLNKLAEAEQQFTKALQLDPSLPKAYANRADIRLRQGRYEEALQDCNRALDLDAGDAIVYNYRGLAAFGLKEFERAAQDFDQALTLNRHYAAAYQNRGLVRNVLGRFADALRDFEYAYVLLPNENFELWLGWGTALLGQERYSAAVERLNRAVTYAQHSGLKNALTKRGFAYLHLEPTENYERARKDFIQALELDPDFSEAYEYLALLATRTGDLRAAVGYYQQALERLPAEDPKLPVLYSNLAQIYLRLKEFGSAAGQFEQVVALAPESEQAAQARRWLEALEKQGLKPPGSLAEDDNEGSAPPVSGLGAG